MPSHQRFHSKNDTTIMRTKGINKDLPQSNLLPRNQYFISLSELHVLCCWLIVSYTGQCFDTFLCSVHWCTVLVFLLFVAYQNTFE